MINNNMSPLSRVWIYQSNRVFTGSEAITIAEKIKNFVNQWTAHKMEVTGFGVLAYNRFIILAADETHVGVSGCSVDSSVKFIRELGNEYQVNFFDRWLIAYKAGEEVRSCSREDFEKLVQSGVVNNDTIVFNNLVQTKEELDTKWQVPFKNSWLKNLSVAHSTFTSVL
ncbi:MAG TPA: hypothetical protein VK154_02915 [Chitinophagales bacterium]|nr:hypothetical protein [Chitinophagales bacterium]